MATWNIFYVLGFINLPAQINCHLFATIVTLDIDVREGKNSLGPKSEKESDLLFSLLSEPTN